LTGGVVWRQHQTPADRRRGVSETRYTVAEAAPLLHVSRARLYELVSARQVPFRKLGERGTIHFLQSDIDQIIANTLVEPLRKIPQENLEDREYGRTP
jgi:excisionase family DNA binding protein